MSNDNPHRIEYIRFVQRIGEAIKHQNWKLHRFLNDHETISKVFSASMWSVYPWTSALHPKNPMRKDSRVYLYLDRLGFYDGIAGGYNDNWYRWTIDFNSSLSCSTGLIHTVTRSTPLDENHPDPLTWQEIDSLRVKDLPIATFADETVQSDRILGIVPVVFPGHPEYMTAYDRFSGVVFTRIPKRMMKELEPKEV